MVQPIDPIPPVPTVKWTWDKQHLFIIAAFVYGAFQTGYPIVLAILAHGTPNVVTFLGLGILMLSTVAAFLKKPPNSIESAIDAGKISVGQASTVLAKRASLRPPAMPTEFPKTEPTLEDPDKTKQF